jgi:transposase InsO family protein
MEKRHQLVLLAKTGEFTVTELCKKFKVSRKTAHKWMNRFDGEGPAGLNDRSRAPKNLHHRTPDNIERIITAERRKHPTWGAKKLRVILERDHEIHSPPAVSTIGEILKRHGLSKPKRRRPGIYPPNRGKLTESERPNHVWCTDHKGWFLLGNELRCIPLTITDLYSRFIIGIEADETSTQLTAKTGFEKAFRKHGIPEIIRVDNGSPFASMGPGRLSKLSVWWMSHGISVEFTRPGSPQDNGSHERMHRTMKAECCRPGSVNHDAQQQRFDRWRKTFNTERPHEALSMRVPQEVYHRSNTTLNQSIKTRLYDLEDETLKVSESGFIYLDGKNLHVGEALSGSEVALDRNPATGLIEVRYVNVTLGEYREGQDEKRILPLGYYKSKNR